MLWNKKCEGLLGLPARSVLGKRCHEVLSGRDAFGNIYCHRNCRIAFQAREKSDPVRDFPLSVATKTGRKWFDMKTFLVPSYHPSLSTIVHVLREKKDSPREQGRPSSFERHLTPGVPVGDVLEPISLGEGQSVVLTRRERGVLQQLARGLTTAAIGKELFISPVTVRNHISAILHKLGVHDKLTAVVFAYKHNLI